MQYKTEAPHCLSFSLHLILVSLSHHHLNLFYLSISPVNLTLPVFLTNSLPSCPPDGLFRFLMSLYLALLDRRNVSEVFYPEQLFSCDLGHFFYLCHMTPILKCLILTSHQSLFLSPFQEIHYDILDALVERMRSNYTCILIVTSFVH